MASRRPGGVALLALAALAALLSAAVWAPSAHAIARDSVLARAQAWVDSPVAYSQSRYHAGYRTDCSGYVSACWATKTSYSTRSFPGVTRRVAVSQLRPGDALLKKGYHIRLFYGWIDPAHTTYLAYEAGTGQVAVARVHSIAGDLGYGYVPVRYKGISDSPSSGNALVNSSFDAWYNTWGSGEQLLSWQPLGDASQTQLARDRLAFHSPRNALDLINPDPSAGTDAQISQTASVSPGGVYRLSAWARTAADPACVEVSVTYLDAFGASIAETSTTGDSWGVDDAALRELSAMTTAPAGAVSAIVSVRLAADTSTDAPTVARIDDVSLVQQRLTTTIRPSTTRARLRRTITLSGAVTPGAASAPQVTLYVQRPGGAWRRATGAPVSAGGDSAGWSVRYVFKRGMRRGTYRFRVVVPGANGRLGSASGTVSVRVR